MHRVIISDEALRDLAKLPQNYQRLILTRLTALGNDPRPRGVKKLHALERVYRIRQGSYRIIYRIDDIESEIAVVRIRPRKDAYR